MILIVRQKIHTPLLISRRRQALVAFREDSLRTLRLRLTVWMTHLGPGVQ